jgi:hypothetical protein
LQSDELTIGGGPLSVVQKMGSKIAEEHLVGVPTTFRDALPSG